MKWLNFGSDLDHYMDLLDPWNVIFKDRYKWKNKWLAFRSNLVLWRILTWCPRKQAQAQHIHTLNMSCPGIHCVETQCLVFIQQRALACLSKSLAHILLTELYTVGNTCLLRREAKMTLLHPHLGDTKHQKLRNCDPKDHSIQLFTDASNEGWGAHIEQTSTKGLWSDREKRLHINAL